MAYSYAYSIIRDLHLAEDVTQEAFIQAFHDLSRLREPLAFPGWLRRIVFKQCDRLIRRKHVTTVALVEASQVAAREMGPGQMLEDQERHAAVRSAISALPDREREVTLLFYIRDYSQQEIADFLQVPVTTVNNRLHAARRLLKERMVEMVEKTVKEYQLPEDFRVVIKRASRTKTSAPTLAWFHDRWVMVWQDGTPGDPWDHPYWFLLAESPDAKDWSEPRRLDIPPQVQHLPKLCVVREELVMYTHDYHHGVRTARTRDLQEWSNGPLLPLGDVGRGGPFAHDRTLFIAYPRWCEIDSIGDAVEVITSADGISWRWLTPPCPSRGTGITDASGLAADGRLYAFWREHAYADEPTHDVYVNWSEDGGAAWSAPVKVDPLCTQEGAFGLAASLSPDGHLVVAQDIRDEDGKGKGEIYVATSADLGQTWPTRATYSTGSLQDVTVAFAPDGALVLAGSSCDDSKARPAVVHSRLHGS